MKNVAYVLSEVGQAPYFEWLARSELASGTRLKFVLLNAGDTPLERNLRAAGAEVHRILYRGKRDLPLAFARLFVRLARMRPDAVHTHLLAANLLGLTAAFLLGIRRRIYTRHHLDVNHGGTLLMRAYDAIPNFLATEVIATCENVRRFLLDRERVRASRVRTIRFGFPEDFSRVPPQERVRAIREKHGYAGKFPVVGMISRYVPYKGVPHAIRAFAKVLERHPNACLVLANAGVGGAAEEIRTALASLPPGSYREIAFEDDNRALFASFDVFVHVPLNRQAEAFGQVYVESMLAGVPSVFTLSGVAHEVVRDGHNAIVVPYADHQAIFTALEQLLGDGELAGRISLHAREDASAEFPFDRMIQELKAVYQ